MLSGDDSTTYDEADWPNVSHGRRPSMGEMLPAQEQRNRATLAFDPSRSSVDGLEESGCENWRHDDRYAEMIADRKRAFDADWEARGKEGGPYGYVEPRRKVRWFESAWICVACFLAGFLYGWLFFNRVG